MAIIYLHGFASAGASPKVDALRARFPQERVESPDLSPSPQEAFSTISDLVRRLYQEGEKKIIFIGTSLGGFYAWYAGARFDAPSILINPAIKPGQSLARSLGQNTNHATGESFEWKQQYLDELSDMTRWVSHNYDPSMVEVVVAMDDAVLDARNILDHFGGASRHSFDTGGHRFENIDRVFPIVQDRYGAIRESLDLE